MTQPAQDGRFKSGHVHRESGPQACGELSPAASMGGHCHVPAGKGPAELAPSCSTGINEPGTQPEPPSAQLRAHAALAREKKSQELQQKSSPDTHAFPSSTIEKICFRPFLLMNS